jgi:Family of unknown function (DUF5670)
MPSPGLFGIVFRWQNFILDDSDFIICITLKNTIMGNLLYVIAVILVIAWAIGFLGYHAGGIIHILLVIAIVAVLLKVIRGSAD